MPESPAKRVDKEAKPAISELFRVKRQGNCVKFNQQLHGLALAFLCEGLQFLLITFFNLNSGIPGTKIHFILDSLQKVFPDLVDSDDKKVPSLQWINSLRDDMTALNDHTTEAFIENSDSLVLCVDQSPTLDSHDCTAIGVTNTQGDFKLLDVHQATSKTGEGIAKEMVQTIEKFNCVEKITYIQSDSARSQKKANRIVSQMFKNHRRIVPHIPCFMHLCEGYLNHSRFPKKRTLF